MKGMKPYKAELKPGDHLYSLVGTAPGSQPSRGEAEAMSILVYFLLPFLASINIQKLKCICTPTDVPQFHIVSNPD